MWNVRSSLGLNRKNEMEWGIQQRNCLNNTIFSAHEELKQCAARKPCPTSYIMLGHRLTLAEVCYCFYRDAIFLFPGYTDDSKMASSASAPRFIMIHTTWTGLRKDRWPYSTTSTATCRAHRAMKKALWNQLLTCTCLWRFPKALKHRRSILLKWTFDLGISAAYRPLTGWQDFATTVGCSSVWLGHLLNIRWPTVIPRWLLLYRTIQNIF